MNNYYITKLKYLLLLFIVSCGMGTVSNDAHIKFSNSEHNFGEIEFKGKAEYNFEFSNPDNSTLLIQNVKTSCGCAKPEWKKKPLKKGDKAVIKVKYDTKYPGKFMKTIKVFYNGKDSPKILKISGSVKFPKTAHAINNKGDN